MLQVASIAYPWTGLWDMIFFMKTEQEVLISFFQQVASRDAGLIDRLSQQLNFRIDDTRWEFSLPNLHEFLQRQETAFEQTDYPTFRRLLYQSPINRHIEFCAAKIIITDNRAHVDESTYALVWNDAQLE
jgi:hypothetical protein